MKKKYRMVLPFVIMPAFIPLYNIIDRFVLLDIFGCGCVPDVQTNKLNIAFIPMICALACFSFWE